MTIPCWFGCSDNQTKEMSNECPYIDSTSETDLSVAAYLNQIHSNPPCQKYFGVGMNHGLMNIPGDTLYTDISGNKYYYITITTVITNDTTLPVHIKINLSKEYAYPEPYNEQKFKVFLTPKKESMQEQIDHNHISEELKKILTPMGFSVTLSNGTLSNGLSEATFPEETKLFLENYIPYTLNKTINPSEKYTITIGMLADIKYIFPGQLALISKGHMYPFFSNYCNINESMTASKSSSLFLGLDFFRPRVADPRGCYLVIPCGEITFSAD